MWELKKTWTTVKFYFVILLKFRKAQHMENNERSIWSEELQTFLQEIEPKPTTREQYLSSCSCLRFWKPSNVIVPTVWLPEHVALRLPVPTYWNMINDDRSSLRPGFKLTVFSSHWLSLLICLVRWPNELMNSLNHRAHLTKSNSLTGTDWTEIDLTFGNRAIGMGWGGGTQCSRKSEKEHGRGLGGGIHLSS